FAPIRTVGRVVRRAGLRGTGSARASSLPAPVPEPEEKDRSSVVDSAVYVDGDRVASPQDLDESYQALRDHPGGVAWIGLYRPDDHELGSLADEFDLHELAVEDAIVAHQRPKLERYDDTLFVV